MNINNLALFTTFHCNKFPEKKIITYVDNLSFKTEFFMFYQKTCALRFLYYHL